SVQALTSTLATGEFKLTARNITQDATHDMEIGGANSIREKNLNHFVDTNGFWIHPPVIMQIVTPTLHVMCDKISLRCGGSSIEITDGAIKIKSAGTIEIHGGDVDVKGQPIKLNS